MFTASARRWVFFSRASHSFLAHCTRSLSRAVKLSKKEEKKREANKQPKKGKEKHLWTDYMNSDNFSNFLIFFYLKEKASFAASEHIEKLSVFHFFRSFARREAENVFREHRVFRRIFSQNCFLLYFSFLVIIISVWQLQRNTLLVAFDIFA